MDPINFIPRVTGSISATASSLIIYLIFRSETKLSSIYHRIMFSMSCADILSSAAIALTTLPMPSEFPCEGNPWEGRAKGNIQTCEAQGFIIVAGGITGLYNAALCVYYACAIAFCMSEEKIHKRVEPFLLSMPVIIGLLGAINGLLFDLYNPAEHWCGMSTIECTVQDESGNQSQYVRGTKEALERTIISRFIIIIIIGITIVISLGLTIRRAWIIDSKLSDRENHITIFSMGTNGELDSNLSGEAVGNEVVDDIRRKNATTKIVTIQALAYTIAYIFTLLLPSILVSDASTNPAIGITIVFFFPLQGFLNFIIFLFHKVYNYRRLHRDVGYCSIISTFFFGPKVEEPLIFSRISLVQLDDEVWNQGVIEDVTGHENGHENISFDPTTEVLNDNQEESKYSIDDDVASVTENLYPSSRASSDFSLFGISIQSND